MSELTGPTPIRPEDRLAMAATIWGEARGESEIGQIAVAWTLVNRWNWPGAPHWWARISAKEAAKYPFLAGVPTGSLEATCKKPWQYSCWYDAQAPRLKGFTAASAEIGGLLAIVGDVLDGKTPDPTGGASHYHTIAAPKDMGWPPAWAVGKKPSAIIGAHRFFKLGPAA